MSFTMLVFAICVGFTVGTIIALLLVGGARHTGPHIAPHESILSARPREAHRT